MAPWFYRALESVSMASALSTALIPFTHARSESINADSLKLQLLTARKKEWWPAKADSLPQAVYLTTVKHTASGNRTHDLPIVSVLFQGCADVWNKTAVKQCCRWCRLKRNSRPLAVLFYFSFIWRCATGFTCDVQTAITDKADCMPRRWK